MMTPARVEQLYLDVADWCEAFNAGPINDVGATYCQGSWSTKLEARCESLDLSPQLQLEVQHELLQSAAGNGVECGTACCAAGATFYLGPRRSVLAAMRKHSAALSRYWSVGDTFSTVAAELLRLDDEASEALFDANFDELLMPGVLRRLAHVRGTRTLFDVERATALAERELQAAS